MRCRDQRPDWVAKLAMVREFQEEQHLKSDRPLGSKAWTWNITSSTGKPGAFITRWSRPGSIVKGVPDEASVRRAIGELLALHARLHSRAMHPEVFRSRDFRAVGPRHITRLPAPAENFRCLDIFTPDQVTACAKVVDADQVP